MHIVKLSKCFAFNCCGQSLRRNDKVVRFQPKIYLLRVAEFRAMRMESSAHWIEQELLLYSSSSSICLIVGFGGFQRRQIGFESHVAEEIVRRLSMPSSPPNLPIPKVTAH